MSIITISRGSYSSGRAVAEKLAAKLGYECVSREVILEASEKFNIPETQLFRAVKDALSILDRFTFGRERYIAYVRAALMTHARKDNLVYHGLAGHFFLQDVPTVLKVRVVANMESRVREAMRRENCSDEEARLLIDRDDEERRKWSLQLYGVDTWNSDNYDIALNIAAMTVDDAVDLLLHNVRRPSFQTTPKSREILDNLTLAAQVKASLVEEFPTADVSAKEGHVFIGLKGPMAQEKRLTARAREMIEGTEGVAGATVHFIPFMTPD